MKDHDVLANQKLFPLSSDLLNELESDFDLEKEKQIAEKRKEIINFTFDDFDVLARVIDYQIGPNVTRYDVVLDNKVSIKAVSNLINDLQVRLMGESVRFVQFVKGKQTIGLEIPNHFRRSVSFKELYSALPDSKEHPLAIPLGKSIDDEPIYTDITCLPHMIIGGTTGSGKSILLNNIILSLIMRNSPDDLKLLLIDPKHVELSRYRDIPHLYCPIINDGSKAKSALEALVEEMSRRYELFVEHYCCNIKEYNEEAPTFNGEKLPYIVVVIDEYADIYDECKEASLPLISLIQKARAAGIHIILATQRPATNVITGVIKANMPAHIALMTPNMVDSMVILGEGGAEKLIGSGDMLVQIHDISPVGLTRLQGAYVSRKDVMNVINFLKEHCPNKTSKVALETKKEEPKEELSFEELEERRYQEIKKWVMTQEFMSISHIQRECGVGFNRAGRYFYRLEQEGIIAESGDRRGYLVIK